jgi:hypothetical protein
LGYGSALNQAGEQEGAMIWQWWKDERRSHVSIALRLSVPSVESANQGHKSLFYTSMTCFFERPSLHE